MDHLFKFETSYSGKSIANLLNFIKIAIYFKTVVFKLVCSCTPMTVYEPHMYPEPSFTLNKFKIIFIKNYKKSIMMQLGQASQMHLVRRLRGRV